MIKKLRSERGQGVRRREAALLALAGCALPAQAQPLRLRTASQVELPLKFDLGHPERPGICVEIIKALKAIDPGLMFDGLERQLPLKRIVQELAANELDLFFSMIDTPERRSQVDFLDGPVLYESHHQVAVRADDRVQVANLAELLQLGGQGQLLVTHGTAYAEYLAAESGQPLSKLALTNSQNLKMLLLGRGRFFYHAGSTLRSQIVLEGFAGPRAHPADHLQGRRTARGLLQAPATGASAAGRHRAAPGREQWRAATPARALPGAMRQP